MKHATTTGALALAAALVLGSGAAAHAESDGVNDSVRDVWRGMSSETGTTYERVGTQVNTDIDRSVAKHARRNVVLTQEFTSLAKRRDGYVALWLIKTDAGDRYVAGVEAQPGAWSGEPIFGSVGGTARLTRPGATAARGQECLVSHDVSYREDTVTVTVPRSCLGRPDWVKGKSIAQSYDNDEYFLDNGHNDGHSIRGFTERLSRG